MPAEVPTVPCSSGTLGKDRRAEQMWFGSSTGLTVCVCVRVEKEVGGMEMAHEGMIWSLAWHPLGHILCSGSNDHTRYVPQQTHV